MEQLRVLMVVSNLRPSNGVTSFVMSYFRKLNHQKVQMDFALLTNWESPYYGEIKKAGGKIFILPPVKNITDHIKECKKIIGQGKYDVISDNSLIRTLPMMACARAQKVPVRILHSHNTRLSSYPQKEKLERIVLPILKRQCTDFCACGREAGKALFGEKMFTIIPNVISPETNAFNAVVREKIRKEMKVSDHIVIGTVGRTSPQKNPYFALNIIQRLSGTIPNLTYWWIGSGEMDHELKNYVHNNNLDNVVHFLGSRNDIADLYQAMDVFFLPSLFEGLPITAVEAQAFGLPCVISSSVTDELVYTDLVQFISLKAPEQQWCEALKMAITRISERRSYTKELEASAFSSTEAGERMTDIYWKMLKKNTK